MREVTLDQLITLVRNNGDKCVVVQVYGGETGDAEHTAVCNPNEAVREYMADHAAMLKEAEEAQATKASAEHGPSPDGKPTDVGNPDGSNDPAPTAAEKAKSAAKNAGSKASGDAPKAGAASGGDPGDENPSAA